MKSVALSIHESNSSLRWVGYSFLNDARAWTTAEVHSTYLSSKDTLEDALKIICFRKNVTVSMRIPSKLTGNRQWYLQIFQLDLSSIERKAVKILESLLNKILLQIFQLDLSSMETKAVKILESLLNNRSELSSSKEWKRTFYLQPCIWSGKLVRGKSPIFVLNIGKQFVTGSF